MKETGELGMTAITIPLDIAEQFAGVQHRSAVIDALDEDERIIKMRAVPYDTETQLGNHLFETFEPGAFARASKDPGRVKLWFGHSDSGGRIVGQSFEVDDRQDGVWLQTRVSKTASGDELMTLAHDGVLDEASIEFAPIRESMVVRRRGEDILVRHRRGHLRGVALVAHGAYGRNAVVTSVRDDRLKQREEWIARLKARTS